jgi:DNA-binding CsgD family transcriptional regulator
MVDLTSAQLLCALKVTRELAELTELEHYPARSVSLLQELLDSDVRSYNAVDPSTSRAAVVADPADILFSGSTELFAQLAHQNPLVSHFAATGDGSALRISDFLTRRQLHATDLYDQVYRELGVEYQLAIALPSPRRSLGMPAELVGLTFNRRNRDFSDAERLLLELVRPHFGATLARLHELALLRAISHGGAADATRWLLFTARDGTVAWASAAAAEGLGLEVGERLRGPIARWRREARAHVEQGREAAGTGARIVRHGEARLRARLVPDAYPQLDALWLSPDAGLPGPGALRTLGLTARQAEVLALVLEGFTSAQVAQSLVLSTRTVEKHLETIYARLGVDNRAQAIATALRAL